MTIRTTIAAAALSTVALLSGTSFAADFNSDLTEAKIASQQVNRETREAVIPALNAAGALNAWGYQYEAQSHLTFARSMLGLSTASAIIAMPVVATPSIANDGFDAQLAEAKNKGLSAGGRDTRDTVAVHLSAAEAFQAQGNLAKAQDHLNYARGKLGLSNTSIVVATPVIAAPQVASTVDTGIVGLQDEAH